MLKSLSINNLRGISSLRMEGLGRVNVLVGTNGVGKSTVLEALAIAGNPCGAAYLAAMSTWREFPPVSLQVDYGFRSYFRDFNVQTDARVEFETKEGTHRVTIRALRPAGGVLNVTVHVSRPQGPVDRELDGIEMEYTSAAGTKHMAQALLRMQGCEERKSDAVQGMGTFLIHARRSSSPGETAGALVHLLKTKQEGLLLEVMQGVDARVKRLLPGMVGDNQAVVMVDVGGPRLLPASAMGDGFGRACLIATALVYPHSRLVAVDEIDSGLDPAVLAKLWGAYIKLYQQFNCQVFCTSCNEHELPAVRKAFAAVGDDLRVFRLERDGAGQATVQRL